MATAPHHQHKNTLKRYVRACLNCLFSRPQYKVKGYKRYLITPNGNGLDLNAKKINCNKKYSQKEYFLCQNVIFDIYETKPSRLKSKSCWPFLSIDEVRMTSDLVSPSLPTIINTWLDTCAFESVSVLVMTTLKEMWL